MRPLLLVERAEILDYCQKNGLKPRFDRSNEDTTYFRNRLRHELLPLLESYNPQIRRVLQRTATVVGDDYELLHNHLLDAWAGVIRQEGPDQIVFDLAGWRALPSSLQRGLLREAIRRLRRSLRNINFVHIENVLWTLREGATGDRMTLPQGLEAVLGYSRFAIGPAGLNLSGSQFPQLAVARLPLTSPGSIALPGSPWRVETALLAPDDLPAGWQQNTDLWQAWLDADVVGPRPALRIRRPGDRFRPLGLGGKGKGLGEFFTNVKIPTAARDRWPLLVASSDDIAWVCGLRIDERARVTKKSRNILHLRISNG